MGHTLLVVTRWVTPCWWSHDGSDFVGGHTLMHAVREEDGLLVGLVHNSACFNGENIVLN